MHGLAEATSNWRRANYTSCSPMVGERGHALASLEDMPSRALGAATSGGNRGTLCFGFPISETPGASSRHHCGP